MHPFGGFCVFGDNPKSTEGFKRKLSAILSADVAGYSRLMGEDDDATVRTLTGHREMMSTLIKQHHGRGEIDHAFKYLEKDYEKRDINFSLIKTITSWHCLGTDPRFIALLKKMGLED